MSTLDRRQFVATGVSALAGHRLIRGARVQPAVDVIVVGAGLSGLVAATDLVAAGKNVAVLEARDRVGGRTFNQKLDQGGFVEAGGQWVGASHEAILALAKTLDQPTFRPFAGQAGGAGDQLAALSVEMLGVVGEFETLGREITLETPWSAPRAAEWDQLTVAQWLETRKPNPATRTQLEQAVRRTLGVGASDVSFLWWLFHLRSGGGYRSLEAVEGGARELRFVNGAYGLALELAKQLEQQLILNSPVARIAIKGGGVEVTTRVANIKAKRVIVAMSPTDAGRLLFSAALPPDRIQLMESWRLAPGFKAHLIYDTPTWRDRGSSGIWTSPDGRMSTIDTTPAEGRPGILAVVADRSTLPAQKARRQAAILAAVSEGITGLAEPKAYREFEWADAWNAGAWSALPPTVLSTLGPALREPVDRIHWAGTETASVSCGLLDGAVRAGHRAAAEVLAAS